MKTLLMELFAGVLLCGVCISQDATPPPTDNSVPKTQQQTPEQPAQAAQPAQSQSVQTGQQPRRIAPGSVIPVELTKTVDAKKVKTGDEVDAKVTQDLKAASGEVVVPKDTKVIGHVTEAQARTKDQKESQLGIAFDHAVTKDGNVESLPMSIQAVIAPPSRQPQTDNSGAGGGAPIGSAPGTGVPSNASSGRSSPVGSGGGTPQSAPGSYPAGGEQPSDNTGENSARQSITANTQGIVGIPNYELSTAGDATQGSIVRSEKGNVKLESGTLMLLKVNQ
jgi:hypothetical protein